MNEKKLKISAFGGFRSIPPKAGGAGSDKFALELYPRLVERGHKVTAYCRIYPNDSTVHYAKYKGVDLKWYKTVSSAGFDTLVHSFKATADIVLHDTADIVHIHSGANSIWAILLRLAGKRVYVSQFAMDWKRDKWPWYGKLFYKLSVYLTAYLPTSVIFDNIYTEKYFEDKFHKKYYFVPYGCEVTEPAHDNSILQRLNIQDNKYFLFVGRFIPDKGVHLLLEAFQNVVTDYKLVLVGGSPNPSEYEKKLHTLADERVIFAGYVYGEDTNYLMKHAYIYIQPSLIEGLSPVILTVMGLGTPLICSDIPENVFITENDALHFVVGDVNSLSEKLKYALEHPAEIQSKANHGKKIVKDRFSWNTVIDQFIDIFSRA
jgi:glycosyltransferase involved in cell wall biosynthesis